MHIGDHRELKIQLDGLLKPGERHLRHILACYMEYYNAARTHLSFPKITSGAGFACQGRIVAF